jgi:hypothetical protein
MRGRGLGAGEGSGAGGLQELGYVVADIAVTENGVAGDEQVGAGADDVGHRGQVDAAIDFNAIPEAAGFADARERFYFAQRAFDEVLAAEAGIHGHDQDVVDDVEDFVEGVDRCRRIDNHGRFASVRTDEMKRAVEVDAGFLMHGDPIGAGLGEGFDEVVGIFDHQVTIERNVADGFAQRGYYRRADGDVGDEMTVHDVDMEDSAAGVDGGLGLVAELGEVGGEDGGCEFDQRMLLADRIQLDDLIIPEDLVRVWLLTTEITMLKNWLVKWRTHLRTICASAVW